jgi:hypothetical protein
MNIRPIDEHNNLFFIENLFPQNIVDAILKTDWLSLKWCRQEGQESWIFRKKIETENLPWIQAWDEHLIATLPTIENLIGKKFTGYQGTGWWLDEPGFLCPIHTDGEMPGALHLTWIGANDSLGTTFYHYKNEKFVRHKFQFISNSGYIMINTADKVAYRHLQWHGMLSTIPKNSYRLTSYTWLAEKI